MFTYDKESNTLFSTKSIVGSEISLVMDDALEIFVDVISERTGSKKTFTMVGIERAPDRKILQWKFEAYFGKSHKDVLKMVIKNE